MFHPVLREFPAETKLIGELVAGYPELEITFCRICGVAIGNRGAVLNAVHKVNTSGARITIASTMAKHMFEARGLEPEFGTVLGMLRYCMDIRNQYAHAHWTQNNGVLHFTKAEDIDFNKRLTGIKWKSTNGALLQQQDYYFRAARVWLFWLESAVTAGSGSTQQKPNHVPRPPHENAKDITLSEVQ